MNIAAVMPNISLGYIALWVFSAAAGDVLDHCIMGIADYFLAG